MREGFNSEDIWGRGVGRQMTPETQTQEWYDLSYSLTRVSQNVECRSQHVDSWKKHQSSWVGWLPERQVMVVSETLTWTYNIN